MKEEIKLTEVQKNLLAPKVEAKIKADRELEESLILIAGDTFKSYDITDWVLTIEKFEEEKK